MAGIYNLFYWNVQWIRSRFPCASYLNQFRSVDCHRDSTSGWLLDSRRSFPQTVVQAVLKSLSPKPVQIGYRLLPGQSFSLTTDIFVPSAKRSIEKLIISEWIQLDLDNSRHVYREQETIFAEMENPPRSQSTLPSYSVPQLGHAEEERDCSCRLQLLRPTCVAPS